MNVNVEIVKSAPRTADAIGLPVASTGPVPRQLGLTRAALSAHGFDGKAGQVLVLPAATGPTLGRRRCRRPGSALDGNALRKRRSRAHARRRQALAHRHVARRSRGCRFQDRPARPSPRVRCSRRTSTSGSSPTSRAHHSSPRSASSPATSAVPACAPGADRGVVIAGATALARDLANTPPSHLTARQIAERAVEVGTAAGIGVEVFDKDKLTRHGLRRHHRRQQGQHRARRAW